MVLNPVGEKLVGSKKIMCSKLHATTLTECRKRSRTPLICVILQIFTIPLANRADSQSSSRNTFVGSKYMLISNSHAFQKSPFPYTQCRERGDAMLIFAFWQFTATD